MEFLVKFVDFPVETKHFSPFHKVQNRLLVLASNNFHGGKLSVVRVVVGSPTILLTVVLANQQLP